MSPLCEHPNPDECPNHGRRTPGVEIVTGARAEQIRQALWPDPPSTQEVEHTGSARVQVAFDLDLQDKAGEMTAEEIMAAVREHLAGDAALPVINTADAWAEIVECEVLSCTVHRFGVHS